MKKIAWLQFEYISSIEKELLIIHFSETVGLYITENYTSPELFIQKGSMLIFTIKTQIVE